MVVFGQGKTVMADYWRAARENDLNLLGLVSKKDSNRRDEGGMTPVHWAASYGNLEALRILMSKDGNANKANNDGSTAVHIASGAGQLSCLVFMTNFGANVHAVDDSGNTPLMEASNRGRADCVRHLEALVNHQKTMDRAKFERLQQKSRREAEKRMRDKARLIEKLDRQWEKKVEKQKKTEQALLSNKISITNTVKKLKSKQGTVLMPRDPGDSDGFDSRRHFSELTSLRSDGGSVDMESPRHISIELESNSDGGSVYRNSMIDLSASDSLPSRISDDIAFARKDFKRNLRDSPINGIVTLPKQPANGVLNGATRVKNGTAHNSNGLMGHSNGIRSAHTSFNGTLHMPNEQATIRTTNRKTKEAKSHEGQFNTDTLVAFLCALDLDDVRHYFIKEKIDLRAVMLCSADDLKDIGLPLGPRKKIVDAINRRNDTLSSPSAMTDSLV